MRRTWRGKRGAAILLAGILILSAGTGAMGVQAAEIAGGASGAQEASVDAAKNMDGADGTGQEASGGEAGETGGTGEAEGKPESGETTQTDAAAENTKTEESGKTGGTEEGLEPGETGKTDGADAESGNSGTDQADGAEEDPETSETGKTDGAAEDLEDLETGETGKTDGTAEDLEDPETGETGKTDGAAEDLEDPETGETGKSDGAAKVPETERKILLTEIAELGEEISSQMVSFGTPQSELTLPAELTAVSESGESVTVAVSWSSEPAYEAEPEELRAGKPGAEEAESEALQVGKSETEEAEPEELRDTKPETEEADGSAAVKEEAQEGSSAEKENTGTESTLSEKNFLFTAALTQEAAGKYELAGEVLLPQIKVTMKAQEEEWEEPETEEKETEREYTASAGGVTVRAYAKRGVLPEEAVLTVEGLEDSDGSLAKTLRESGKEFDALLAVEVSFRADGQETEPAGPVRVVMEAGADRLSESVDGSSLALHHVTGDAVQTVAGADGENSGTITRTESGVTAEFTTESFSPFVFTWSQIKAAPAAKARAYDLYVYTLIPDKEENPSADPDTLWNGMNLGKIRAERSAASYSVNTRLREGDDSIQRWINNGTIQIQPAEFPPITYDGITYQYARTAEQESTVGYYTITWTKVIVSDGANRGNNGYFGQAVPSGTNTFHLDGVLNLNREGRYDVHFAVKDAGAEDFVIQEGYSRSVRENSPAGDIDRPDPDHHPVDYPRTKTADGVTYVFDGWYRDQACADRVEDWEREFVTQNVTYYARYIPQTLDLTVTKQVAGDMGDKQKQFHFSYSYPGADGEAVTGTFDLADGGSYMITGLAAGVVLTLTENNANGYDIAAEYGGRAEGVNVNEQTRQIQVTLSADRTELVVTNRKDVVPDTDVPLDSTPYLTMLALAAAGAVLLAKRRSIRDGK